VVDVVLEHLENDLEAIVAVVDANECRAHDVLPAPERSGPLPRPFPGGPGRSRCRTAIVPVRDNERADAVSDMIARFADGVFSGSRPRP
jgi:hypothetical protein